MNLFIRNIRNGESYPGKESEYMIVDFGGDDPSKGFSFSATVRMDNKKYGDARISELPNVALEILEENIGGKIEDITK